MLSAAVSWAAADNGWCSQRSDAGWLFQRGYESFRVRKGPDGWEASMPGREGGDAPFVSVTEAVIEARLEEAAW